MADENKETQNANETSEKPAEQVKQENQKAASSGSPDASNASNTPAGNQPPDNQQGGMDGKDKTAEVEKKAEPEQEKKAAAVGNPNQTTNKPEMNEQLILEMKVDDIQNSWDDIKTYVVSNWDGR